MAASTSLQTRNVEGGNLKPVIIADIVGGVSIPITGDVEVVQPTHDDLNANVNIQVNDTDVGAGNPVPVSQGDAEGITYFDSAAANVNTPAVNTAAVVTYAGVAAQRHYIKGVAWSYDTAPTAGTLIITDGGVTVFHQYVSAAGPGFQEFPGTRGMRCGVNSTVVITLAAAGAAVSGSVSVKGHMVA